MGDSIEVGSLDAEYRAVCIVMGMVALERAIEATDGEKARHRAIALDVSMMLLGDADGHCVQEMVTAARGGRLDERHRELCELLGKDAEDDIATWAQIKQGKGGAA